MNGEKNNVEWIGQWKCKRRQMLCNFTFPLANQLHAHMEPIKGKGENLLIKINQPRRTPLFHNPEELVQEREKMFYKTKACIAKSLGLAETDPQRAIHYPQTQQSVVGRYWERAKM